MPSNYTPNYQLSQWERSDAVLMDDFNTDNAKIDAALAAKADKSVLDILSQSMDNKADKPALDALAQTVSGHTSALTGKGNCEIWSTTYVGNGQHGPDYTNTLYLPKTPLAVFIIGADGSLAAFTPGQTAGLSFGTSGSVLSVSFGGTILRWSNHQSSAAQMNIPNSTYRVIALLAV